MEREKKKLLELLKKDKVRNAVLLMGVLGILLIYLSTLFTPSSKKDTASTATGDTAISVREYEAKLEEKLRKIVVAITGDETPTVMVSMESDATQVYAKDEKNKEDGTKNYQDGTVTGEQNNHDSEASYIILKDTDGNQHALKITEIQPKIKGVVVVSKKAEDILVQEKIINAMKTALGISSAKVYVAAAFN